MKRLWLFSGLCGLLLGSAAPPPSSGRPTRAEAPAAVAGAQGATPFDADADAGADAVRTPIPMGPIPMGAPATEPAVAARAPSADPPEPEPAATAEKRSDGGVRVVISLPQQKAYVFKDGRLFATSPVSTGKSGHETPAGTFRILQKKVRHRSSRYDSPMPYMQRLTWYGIALHAGRLPGYPASHGCIRLPSKFARKLYRMTDFSTQVTVTHARPKSAAAALDLA